MTTETWVSGSYTATYMYDAANELTSVTDPFSFYAYTYDGAGRLQSVDNNGTPGVPHLVLTNSC
jgi:YD repeat-containing protein